MILNKLVPRQLHISVFPIITNTETIQLIKAIKHYNAASHEVTNSRIIKNN